MKVIDVILSQLDARDIQNNMSSHINIERVFQGWQELISKVGSTYMFKCSATGNYRP